MLKKLHCSDLVRGRYTFVTETQDAIYVVIRRTGGWFVVVEIGVEYGYKGHVERLTSKQGYVRAIFPLAHEAALFAASLAVEDEMGERTFVSDLDEMADKWHLPIGIGAPPCSAKQIAAYMDANADEVLNERGDDWKCGLLEALALMQAHIKAKRNPMGGKKCKGKRVARRSVPMKMRKAAPRKVRLPIRG